MTEELETQIEVAPDHESKRSTLTRRSVLGGAALALTGAALAACSTNSSADQTGTGATTTSLLKKIQDRGQHRQRAVREGRSRQRRPRQHAEACARDELHQGLRALHADPHGHR